MNELYKQHKNWAYADISDDALKKLKGRFFPGCRVVIKWDDGVIDEGYTFTLPECDETMNDFFVHVPQPDNSEGIGDADPQWQHINVLLVNDRVKTVNLKKS